MKVRVCLSCSPLCLQSLAQFLALMDIKKALAEAMQILMMDSKGRTWEESLGPQTVT